MKLAGVNINPERLMKLDSHTYRATMKMCLKDELHWPMFETDLTVHRTRIELGYMIESIDRQKERVLAAGTSTESWIRSIDGLRRMVVERLMKLPATDLPLVSGNKEAKAWRATAARLADELAKVAPESLETIQAPYGGQSVAQWHQARTEKAS